MARDLKEVYDQRPPMAQTLQPFADVMRRGFPNTAASVADLNARMTKAREQGGAPGTVGASFGAFQTMGRGLAQDVGGAVTKVIDPYANALKGAVTGDYTPINQAAPAIAPTASSATSMLPKGRFDPLAPPSGGQLYPMPGMERQQDWSSAKVVPTNFAAPAASGAGGAGGTEAGGAGTPLGVKVERQANGNLSFTGVGGPGVDVNAGVNYTGMPKWSSNLSVADAASRGISGTNVGGAGKGGYMINPDATGSMAPGGGLARGNTGFNLAEQNAKMASALQGIRDFDMQKQRSELVDKIASGSGGAIGVAQNKMALAGLADAVDTKAKNDTSLAVAGMQTGAQLAGQKSAEGIAANRDATTKYGYDTQAKSQANMQEIEKQKLAAQYDGANAKLAAGKPTSEVDKIAINLFKGLDPEGKPYKSAADYQEAQRRFARTLQHTSYQELLMGQAMEQAQAQGNP